MTKRVGKIRKQFLSRERLLLIVEYLCRPEKQRNWTEATAEAWADYLRNLEDNITILYYKLRYQVWNPKPFIIFEKMEMGKLRIIYASYPEEQIVDNLYTDCLNYVFFDQKKIVPANCYGSIKGKGQHEMRRAIIRKVRHRTDLYVGISDTQKYYPTMNHRVLMQTLCQHIKDRWLLWLSRVNLKRMGDLGIALGLPSSNPIGHIYHAALDWMILLAYKVRRYYRFCDNKFVIHKDVNYTHTVMRVLRDQTEAIGQRIKADWRVVWCKEERFECLGAMINSHSAKLRTKSRRRIERMMRLRIKEGDPMKALASWSGVKGSLRDLSVSNLIDYWKRNYPEFFHLLRWAREMLSEARHRKKWHRKLERILTIAKDLRSDHNKTLYPYGLINTAPTETA